MEHVFLQTDGKLGIFRYLKSKSGNFLRFSKKNFQQAYTSILINSG